jgi:DMSO reductase anchor subunit
MIGACLGLGGFFSFAHLGAKRNAWRAPFHLKKSWLSREILFFGLFGAGWLAGFVLPEMKWATSLLGVGLIFSMAQVYRLHAMPAWDTWRTTVGFFVTSVLLGQAAMLTVSGAKSGDFAVLMLLAVELGLILSAKPNARWTVNRLRVGLIVCAIVGAGILSVAPNPLGMWISLPIFLIVLFEEIIGRKLFYKVLEEKVF